MAPLATLTLVWLGAHEPDAASSAALQRWAEQRSVRLEQPAPEASIDGAASQNVVERCERSLDEARGQLQAGDEEGARTTLGAMERNLREHPDILQAAWLMAERHRLEARIARGERPEQAAHWEKLADVLEGKRATAFGEPSRTASTAPPQIQLALTVHGARRFDVYWDGAPSTLDLATAPGEHHLLVMRGARVAWAGWVGVLSSGHVDVWVPDAPPCAAEDFTGVAVESDARVRVPSAVRCTAWAAAWPGPTRGTVHVAVCAGNGCHASTTLGEAGAPPIAAKESASGGFLPGWATWTLAGVGAAAATSIVLWQSGAFDSSSDRKIVYDGSHL